MVVWLTGLPCSGKTTLGERVARDLRAGGHRVEVLDGDVVRRERSPRLGFSRSDREENVRLLACMAEDLARQNVVAIVCAIAPYRALRLQVREQLGDFVEVYLSAPLAACEARDMKGLYRRARSGELRGFTGIDDPYEPPLAPEIECATATETLEQSAQKVLAFLSERIARQRAGISSATSQRAN